MTKIAKVDEPRELIAPTKLQFGRNLFLYFWFFSLVGHILELIWGLIQVAAGSRTWESFTTIPIIAVAVPYGLGAVALLLTLYPLIRKKKLNLVWIFVLGMLITTTIEFICAVGVVLIFGSNPFWNYSKEPFNLFGYVCLGNALLFGIGATILLRYVFPLTEKLLRKIKDNYLNIAFWVLFIGYIATQIIHFIVGY
jgi:uncharacterized membrane protein